MKKLTLILVLSVFSVFSATVALADLYQWQDKEGVIHITDSLEKVPDAYRDKVKVYESAPPATGEKKAAPAPETAAPAPPPEVELYGDHTLEWWRQTFIRKGDEAQMMESNVTVKRQFIDMYERGRSFGQTFDTNEVQTYSRYKKELPDDEERLTSLKNEIDDLRREARISGVPREVRRE